MASIDPTYDQLKSRLIHVLSYAKSLEAVVYRSSTPRYANGADLLTGEGSRLNGGRWNPVGIALVYCSLTPNTAMSETLAHFSYYGIPFHNAMPRTFVAVEVNLQRVIDIREGAVRRRLQVSLHRMLDIDWRKSVREGREPIPQLLGRAAADAGIEALLVPSAADHSGQNLLVFPKNLLPGSGVRVLN